MYKPVMTRAYLSIYVHNHRSVNYNSVQSITSIHHGQSVLKNFQCVHSDEYMKLIIEIYII